MQDPNRPSLDLSSLRALSEYLEQQATPRAYLNALGQQLDGLNTNLQAARGEASRRGYWAERPQRQQLHEAAVSGLMNHVAPNSSLDRLPIHHRAGLHLTTRAKIAPELRQMSEARRAAKDARRQARQRYWAHRARTLVPAGVAHGRVAASQVGHAGQEAVRQTGYAAATAGRATGDAVVATGQAAGQAAAHGWRRTRHAGAEAARKAGQAAAVAWRRTRHAGAVAARETGNAALVVGAAVAAPVVATGYGALIAGRATGRAAAAAGRATVQGIGEGGRYLGNRALDGAFQAGAFAERVNLLVRQGARMLGQPFEAPARAIGDAYNRGRFHAQVNSPNVLAGKVTASKIEGVQLTPTLAAAAKQQGIKSIAELRQHTQAHVPAITSGPSGVDAHGHGSHGTEPHVEQQEDRTL